MSIRGRGPDRLAISAASANGRVFTNLDATTGEALIEGVTLRDGAAVDSGVAGPLTFLDRCLVDGNTGGPAIRVGGVAGASGLRMQNSTVSGNEGGIVLNAEGPGGPHHLWASTIAENGPLNLVVEVDDQVNLEHTILVRSAGGANCALGGVVYLPPGSQQMTAQLSIADDASCQLGLNFNLEGVDPEIGPLADNGGPTFTRAPLPGSPAIDGAVPLCSGFPLALEVDQRGRPRPVAATPGGEIRCDIGAVEVPEPDRALAMGVAVAAVARLSRRRRHRGGGLGGGRHPSRSGRARAREVEGGDSRRLVRGLREWPVGRAFRSRVRHHRWVDPKA